MAFGQRENFREGQAIKQSFAAESTSLSLGFVCLKVGAGLEGDESSDSAPLFVLRDVDSACSHLRFSKSLGDVYVEGKKGFSSQSEVQ